jgi:hypothetical protein
MNEAASRLTQLVEQMEIAEKKAAVTLEISKALEERLRGHLRQPQPTSTAANKNKVDELTPAAEKLRNIHNTVGDALNTLQGILERLEA